MTPPDTANLLTSLITQLSTFPSIQATNGQKTSCSKNLLLTLHCLFPNELLLALDTIDRRLIRRYRCNHRSSNEHEHEEDDNDDVSMNEEEEVFFVASTSTNPSTHGKTYEVRLNAWNCSCPAFAICAFQQYSTPVPPAVEGEEGDVEDDDENDKTAWFGGTLVRHCCKQLVPLPICKHLLACVLAGKCAMMFGHGIVEDRVVGREELAGLCAGF